MTKNSSKEQKSVKTGSDDHNEHDACQKCGNIWLCGDPEEVREVMTHLKEQQENTSKPSPNDAEETDSCSIFDDESSEKDQVEDD